MSTIDKVAAPRAYLDRPLPIALILGTFFAVTVPLAVVCGPSLATALSTMESIALSPLTQIYVGCLGITHFLCTLTIYMQSGNLRHFASSTANKITFLAIPLAIFIWFDLYYALEVDRMFPRFAVLFFAVIRFFDFMHFNRQSYGVHQLFKGKTGKVFPAWQRRVENCYFWCLTGLLFKTFLAPGHRMPILDPVFLVLLAIAVGLLATIVFGYVKALRQADEPRKLLVPAAYLALQTAAAALAAYSTALYLFSLAVHYVEYHVLMAPRMFATPLDANSNVDRWFGRLRKSKLLFYGLLLVGAALYLFLAQQRGQSGASPVAYRLLIHVFDGLFVFHYFVEAFIWKFGDPYFRKALTPLYFPAPAAGGAGA